MPDHWLHCNWLIVQRDLCICRDHMREVKNANSNPIVIITRLEIRDHFTTDVANFAVWENALKTVPDFNPALVILNCKQHENAAVGSLAAYLPLLFQAVGKIGRIIAVKRLNRDDMNLRIRAARVQLGAKTLKTFNCLWRKHMRKVRNVSCGFGQVFYPLGPRADGRKTKHRGREQPEEIRNGTAKAYHRSLFYAGGCLKVPRRLPAPRTH